MADFKYQRLQRIGEKDVTQVWRTSRIAENCAGTVLLPYLSQVSMNRTGCEQSVAILSAIAFIAMKFTFTIVAHWKVLSLINSRETTFRTDSISTNRWALALVQSMNQSENR